MTPLDFSVAIERARQTSGLSRAEVARRAGLSAPGLAKALRPGANPTLRTMQRIAAAVGCNLRLFVVQPAVMTLSPQAPHLAPDLELVLAA